MPVTIVHRFEDGELQPDGLANQLRLEQLINSLKNGERLEVTYEKISDDQTYAQLSKVHACIRQIAKETGHSFDDIKKEVKQRSGLYSKPEKLRSFANCSKEELSHAIHEAEQLGEEVGLNLKTL